MLGAMHEQCTTHVLDAMHERTDELTYAEVHRAEGESNVSNARGRVCECGCGTPVSGATRRGPRRYVTGHNLRTMERTDEHRAAISAACRVAWATKRERMPLGSRRRDSNGYWLVKVREGGGRWDKEHVLIAEAVIGRKLAPGEHVHHINCVRDDNRAENLVVLTAGAHTSAHHSLNDVVAGLIADGLLIFNLETGRYERA